MHQRKLVPGLAILVFTAFAPPDRASAQTIYVDANATGSPNDGSSWCNAYTQLYEALAVATPGTQVRVADGAYLPDTSGLGDPREATFQLLNGVYIWGGFAGCGAPDPDEVDGYTYHAVLSGDIGTPGDPSDNVYHVVTGSGTDDSAVLDFFYISGGQADGAAPHDSGAGMIIIDGSPVVFLGMFSDNSATGGGGAMLIDGISTPYLNSCDFRQNSAPFGGAMRIQFGAEPVLDICSFEQNSAGPEGGAVNNVGSTTQFHDCRFVANTATSGFGGAIWNEASNSLFNRCIFESNSASANGGAVFNIIPVGGLRFTSSIFILNTAGISGGAITNSDDGDVSMTNCLLHRNSALSQNGGALENINAATASLTNCTVSDNTANGVAGGIISDATSVVLANSILWRNSDGGSAGVEGAQVFVESGAWDINHTCIEGLTGGLGGAGNIGDDPMFVDPDVVDADYRFQQSSPCIDVGDNSVVTESNDLDGNTRIADGDGNGSAIVDMGAYEYQAASAIPTVSQWGMIAMTLLILTAGTVVMGRRRVAAGDHSSH